MYDLMAVRMFHRRQDLGGDFQSIAPRQFLFGLEQLIECQAIDVFHDDILNIIVIPHVKNRNDIRMTKLLCRSCLVLESFNKFIIITEFFFQHFNSNDTPGFEIDRPVNKRHSAFANLFMDFISVIQDISFC